MKRKMTILLALVLSMSLLSACGAQGTQQATQETTSQEAATEPVIDSAAESDADKDDEPEATSSLSEYWTADSKAAEALRNYVEAVTDEGSADFVPAEDRIAVFDLDGTLMCETFPWCFEYMVFADYALNNDAYDAPEDVRAVAQEIIDSAWGEKPSEMSTRQAAAAAVAYAGVEPQAIADYCKAFRDTPADGYTNMTRGEAWYKPMVELVSYLQANDFEVYIVTATERNVVRGIVDGVLDIAPSHVIGTEYGYVSTGQGEEEDGDYTFQSGDAVVFEGSYAGENAKMNKVDAIVREIGQQPVLAFGNSSGDVAMMEYVISNNPYKSASFMVLADDATRDHGDPEEAASKTSEYEELGFTTISMANDFATIYGDDVEIEQK